MSRNALPAAVLVSIGCSVAFRDAPFGPQGPYDILEVADAASKSIDPGDHKSVARSQEV